jgi:hypothetical protein
LPSRQRSDCAISLERRERSLPPLFWFEMPVALGFGIENKEQKQRETIARTIFPFCPQ